MNVTQDEPYSLRFVNHNEIAAIQTLDLKVDKMNDLTQKEEGTLNIGLSHAIFTMKSGRKLSGVVDFGFLDTLISNARHSANERR